MTPLPLSAKYQASGATSYVVRTRPPGVGRPGGQSTESTRETNR
jgi:hypothetical protein